MSLCTQQMMCVGIALHPEECNSMTSDTSQEVCSKQAYVTKSAVHVHDLLDVQNAQHKGNQTTWWYTQVCNPTPVASSNVS